MVGILEMPHPAAKVPFMTKPKILSPLNRYPLILTKINFSPTEYHAVWNSKPLQLQHIPADQTEAWEVKARTISYSTNKSGWIISARRHSEFYCHPALSGNHDASLRDTFHMISHYLEVPQ